MFKHYVAKSTMLFSMFKHKALRQRLISNHLLIFMTKESKKLYQRE
jgi:hypothetical protein